jgi:hypothetical protein
VPRVVAGLDPGQSARSDIVPVRPRISSAPANRPAAARIKRRDNLTRSERSLAPRFDSSQRGVSWSGEGPAQRAPPPVAPYPAEKARAGEIILNTPARRAVFIAGLVGAVLLVIVLGLLARM